MIRVLPQHAAYRRLLLAQSAGKYALRHAQCFARGIEHPDSFPIVRYLKARFLVLLARAGSP